MTDAPGGRTPWDRSTCTLVGLGRLIAIAALKPYETLCDGCWEERSRCGGLPPVKDRAP